MTHPGYPYLCPLSRNACRFEAWASSHLNARLRGRQGDRGHGCRRKLPPRSGNIATATAGANDGRMISGARTSSVGIEKSLPPAQKEAMRDRVFRANQNEEIISRLEIIGFTSSKPGTIFPCGLHFSSSQSSILSVRTRDMTNAWERWPPTESNHLG